MRLLALSLALSLAAAPAGAWVMPTLTNAETCEQMVPDHAGAVAHLRCLVQLAETSRERMAEQLRAADRDRARLRAQVEQLSDRLDDMATEVIILRRAIEAQNAD